MTGAVGFVGLGEMGAPIAGHLVAADRDVVVYDVRAEAMAPLVAKGARAAGSLAELGGQCDFVSVMVLDDDQVRAVVAELLPTLPAGAVVAIHSTIHPATAEELAATALEQGVHIVDAPVSGGFMGAHEGSLAVLVGGDEEAVARSKEVFAPWAKLVVRFGPAGAGTRAKLARNLITFASYAAVTEAQRLAEAAGIDLRRLARVVRHSDAITGGASSIMIRETTAPMDPDDQWWGPLSHARVLAEKDLSLAVELARELAVDVPIAELALAELGPGLGLPRS